MKMALNNEEPKVDPTEEQGKADPKVEEPKEDEKPKEEQEKKDDPKVDPQVDETEKLKGEIKELKKTAKEYENLTKKMDDLSVETEKNKGIIAGYEALLTNIIETKLEAIPTDLKELIPENMDLVQKLTWLEKAEKRGLFNKQEKKKDVEVGKPLNVETPKVDTAKMSPAELFKLAYNTVKK